VGIPASVSQQESVTPSSTCVLPWDDRLRFDEDAFREHVRLAAAHMTRHLYVFGTAGEGYAVTEMQFRDIVLRPASVTGRQQVR